MNYAPLSRAIAIVCTVAVSAMPVNAQSIMPSALTALFMQRLVPESGVGVAIATYDRGRIEVATTGPLLRNSVVEIGSVTKTFTALLLADMVQRQEVALDDPIEKFLPPGMTAPTRAGKHITLLDLATQSSGLPSLPANLLTAATDPGDPYHGYTVDKLYDYLSHAMLAYDIGTHYEYSNLGVGLLGVLLANRAHRSYDALLRERITGPLRMTATSVALSPAQRAAFAAGHDVDGDPAGPWDLASLAGAGGIRSTLDDMVKFMACAAGTGPPELVAAMKFAQTAVPGRRGEGGMAIGLVWQIDGAAGTIWHNGATGGFHAFLGFDRDRTRGVVVLSNSTDSIDDIGFYALDPAKPLRLMPAEIVLPPSAIESYVGTFAIGSGATITITRDGTKLYAQLTGQQRFRLHPSAPNEFFLRVVDAQITFVPATDGRITGLVLHQNGRSTPAPRT